MRTFLIAAAAGAAIFLQGAITPAFGQPPPPPSGGGPSSGGPQSGPPPPGGSGSSPSGSAGSAPKGRSAVPTGEAGGAWGSLRAEPARADSTRGGETSGGQVDPPPPPAGEEGSGTVGDDLSAPATEADASGVYRSLRYEEKNASVKKSVKRAPLPELEDDEPVPMTLADARVNFETVVQIHLAQKAVDGILKVPAGTTGRRIPVKAGAVDLNSVAFAGQGRYTGLIKGTDARSAKPLLLEATANMAAASWTVEELRLLPGGAAPSAKTLRARSLYALAVRRHVRGIVNANNGVFFLKDDVLKRRWELRLKRIHQNRLVSLGEGRYFTCVDFAEAEGDEVVDADIYAVEGKDGWKVERTLIHAVGGVPRFAYDENYKIVPVSKKK